MDSTAKKKPAPLLRLVRSEEEDQSPQAPEPKSAIGKELTRFADELDKEIARILNS